MCFNNASKCMVEFGLKICVGNDFKKVARIDY